MSDIPAPVDEQGLKKFLASKEELTLRDDERYAANFAYSDYYNLRKLTLGKSLIDIYNGAFFGSEKLQEIDLGQNKNFAFKDGCLIQKRKKRLCLCLNKPRIPDEIMRADFTCFLQPAFVDEFYIGKNLEDLGRVDRKFKIGHLALHPENEHFELENDCLFKKGTDELVLGCDNSVIPERTTLIGAYAFYNCSFTSVTVPANVKRIEFGAFENCRDLAEVNLPESLYRIEDYAFKNCKALKSIEFPAGLRFYYEDSFAGCKGIKITQRKK